MGNNEIHSKMNNDSFCSPADLLWAISGVLDRIDDKLSDVAYMIDKIKDDRDIDFYELEELINKFSK